MAGYAFQFLWGLGVLSALIGWGLTAARLAGAPRPDWGLSAGWGMAVMVIGGGGLSFAGLATAPVVIGVVLVGVALHLVSMAQNRSGPVRGEDFSRLGLVLLALIAVVLLGRYGAAVTFQAANCSDDDVAYFTYVSRLLQTGTLIEPYSLRRLSGYGGHTFLQALIMAAGTEDNGFLMDRGVAVLVSFGLVAGLFTRQGGRGVLPYLLALVLTVILPYPLANSSSHMTGLALFLTLFRTLDAMPLSATEPGPGVRRLWLAGAVVAATAALKAHYMVVAALTVVFWWSVSAFYARPDWRLFLRRHLSRFIHIGLSALVFLIPWMALMDRSSGTILFPLFQGNHQPGFSETYSGSLEVAEQLASLGGFFLSPQVALFSVPLILYAVRRGPAAGLGLYLAALVTAAVTTWTLTFDNLETLHRYAAPFLNAAFIVTVVGYLDTIRQGLPDLAGKGGGAVRVGDGILVCLVVVLLPVPLYHDFNRFQDTFGKTVMTDEHRAQYAAMQAAIPEGQRVLAILDQPFALDYRRNRVFNIDVPGAVSPKPGMPFLEGPARLKAYLKGQSIAYVAFRNFDIKGGCLYRRDLWNHYALADNPMWRAQSKSYLDLMDNVAELARTETRIFPLVASRANGLGLTVIKLR
ncbi:MAG: hypothetical protein HQ494_07855 [Rhodospirillales bacterium]|nr:hypothetical protein [Rhodospirillales bacterium]